MGASLEPNWEWRFRATGVIVLSVFAAIWSLAGAAYLPNVVAVPVRIGALTISGMIIIASTLLLRAVRRLDRKEGQSEAKAERTFYIITGIEVGALGASYWILTQTQHASLIVPVGALTVGLHFLPMARLLNIHLWFMTGAVLVSCGLVGLVGFVTATQIMGSAQGWVVFAALGSGATLWLTSLITLIRGNRFIRGRSAPGSQRSAG